MKFINLLFYMVREGGKLELLKRICLIAVPDENIKLEFYSLKTRGNFGCIQSIGLAKCEVNINP